MWFDKWSPDSKLVNIIRVILKMSVKIVHVLMLLGKQGINLSTEIMVSFKRHKICFILSSDMIN